MSEQDPPQRLFPESADAVPSGPGAPRLPEQILGVFTDPVPLFRRLAAHPRWGAALVTLMGFTLVMVLVWAARVDADALLRAELMRKPHVAPADIDRTIEVWGRLLGLLGGFGVLVGMPVMTLFLAFLFWLVGRAAPGPGGCPDYRRALSATVAPALAGLPKTLLVTVLCLARPVRGLAPDAISPLSLGVLHATGHAGIDALLRGFDLFALANLVLLYLAARHIMGLKAAGATACAAAWMAVTVACLLLAAG